ncbi:hypothetical protein ACYX34_01170 [Nitrospira sp. CMX1]|nr:hypothetical protein [Nitrospira sp.]MBS0165448.1 hypothetical protein [Nitrospira sp.]
MNVSVFARSVVFVTVLLLGILTVVPCGMTEELLSDQPKRVDLTLGTWISVGDTRWAHNASSQGLLGNPTSRLTYADHSTNVVELTAKVYLRPRFFGRVQVGGAHIGGGRLTDDDFLAADGGNPSLRTHSDISGSGLWFLNADLGGSLMTFPHGQGHLDGFLGFQYWRQEHKAYGVRQVSCSVAGASTDLDINAPGLDPLCVPGGVGISNRALVLSNSNAWYALRVGAASEYHLLRWLTLHGSIVLKPINFFTNEDTHHLRVADGELQAPSFTMRGIGFGADAEIGATLHLTRWLAAQVGYRVWWNRLIEGTWESHLTDGRSASFPLTEFQSLRHGLTAGLTASF